MDSFWLLNIGIFLGFFVQTTTGFGAALVSLPLVLMALPFTEAVAFLSIFLLLFSMVMVPKNRKSIDKTLFWKLAIPVTIGLVLGIQILKYGNPVFLKKLLGAFTLLYVIHYFSGLKKIRFNTCLTQVFGFLGGTFSGLFSAGGPLYVIAIHSQLRSVSMVRGTVIGILAVNNFLRVPLLFQSDILTFNTLKQTLSGLPTFIMALILGHIFYNKINKKLLGHIIMTLLFLMGVFLILG